LEWIKLFRDDVTRVLCGPRQQRGAAQPAPRETLRKSRSRPVLDRARLAIRELYPNRVPTEVAEPNTLLCRHVANKLKELGLPNVSDDTILRAAGRRG
jgi:hypothetical protein